MYENLMRRAELCEQAGSRTTGVMRVMWLVNAERLREKALALTVQEAYARWTLRGITASCGRATKPPERSCL